MSQTTLVFTSAKTCPACINFATRWPEIKKVLDVLNLNVIEISLPNTGSKIDTTLYPKNLERYIAWYPTFALFRGEDWKNAISQPSTDYPLNGYVFNGEFDEKGKLGMAGKRPLSADGLSDWIKSTGLSTSSNNTSSLLGNTVQSLSDSMKPQTGNKIVFVPHVGAGKQNICGIGGPIVPPKMYKSY
jgi:hypothetical protein